MKKEFKHSGFSFVVTAILGYSTVITAILDIEKGALSLKILHLKNEGVLN